MTTVIETQDEFVVTVTDDERWAVAQAAHELVGSGPGRVDHPDWIAAARDQWHRMPAGLRQSITRYRRDPGLTGALLVRGLPSDHALPETPRTAGSVQADTSVSAAVLLTAACGLGEPVAFRAEKSGALVQDVVPVPGQEEVQGNSGSVLLTFHTENAFHEHRPDFVMLLCLRADPAGVAGLRIACIRQALPMLGLTTRQTLGEPEFVTNPPPSFGGLAASSVVHPILSGDADDPDVRVDFAATAPTTERARIAMRELELAFDSVATTIRFQPGDLAIVDNRLVVHGRTAFQPRYDGQDRWLQRTFAATDLRRSRIHRPHNGNVLAS